MGVIIKRFKTLKEIVSTCRLFNIEVVCYCFSYLSLSILFISFFVSFIALWGGEKNLEYKLTDSENMVTAKEE